MAIRDRFASRGYLVRLIFGRKPQVFCIPGPVSARVWRIERGVAVKGMSMSEALFLANKIYIRETAA